jgi:hypothetical protein
MTLRARICAVDAAKIDQALDEADPKAALIRLLDAPPEVSRRFPLTPLLTCLFTPELKCQSRGK